MAMVLFLFLFGIYPVKVGIFGVSSLSYWRLFNLNDSHGLLLKPPFAILMGPYELSCLHAYFASFFLRNRTGTDTTVRKFKQYFLDEPWNVFVLYFGMTCI